jgi:hypothetical protein
VREDRRWRALFKRTEVELEVAARLRALEGAKAAEEAGTFKRPFASSARPTMVFSQLPCIALPCRVNVSKPTRNRARMRCAGPSRRLAEDSSSTVSASTTIQRPCSRERGMKPGRRAPRPAAEVALEREFEAGHYAEWAHQPLPALGGATPLEVVRKPSGRRKVELLLKEFENHESRLPEEETLRPLAVAPRDGDRRMTTP